MPKRSKPITPGEVSEPSYPALISELPDGRHRGTVPDLPGCEAEGPDYATTLTRLGEAKRAWITAARADGRALPPPLSATETQRETALRAPFAVLDAADFRATANPVFAFRALAATLLAYPEIPLDANVKAYFINAAASLELHPQQLVKADARDIIANLAARLGLASKGANAIKTARSLEADRWLAMKIAARAWAEGKSKARVIDEIAENEIARAEHKESRARTLHRKAARGRRD